MVRNLTIGRMLRLFLAAACLVGCSHPAKTKLSLREIEEVIRRNSDLLQQDSTNVPAHIALAQAYIEKAKIAFSRNADEYSYYPIWYHVKEGDSSVRDLSRAVWNLERALGSNAHDEQVYTLLGYALVQRGKLIWDFPVRTDSALREGRKLLLKALEINPLSSTAHYYLGLSYYYPYGGPARQATIHLERALSLDPKFAEAHFLISRSEHDTPRASHYRKALSLGLSDPLALVSIGEYYEFGSGHDIGISFTHETLRQIPEFARVAFGLGVMFFLKPNEQKAEEMYMRAFEIDSLSPRAMARLCPIFWQRGDTLKAIDLFLRSGNGAWRLPKQFYEKVLALHPDCAKAYLRLAGNVSDDDEMKVTLLKRAIDLDPKMTDAYSEMAELFKKKGTPEKAIEYLERLERGRDWGSYGTRGRLAGLYMWTRQYDKFIDLYRRTKAQGREFVLDAPFTDYWFTNSNHRVSLSDIRLQYSRMMSADTKSNALILSSLARVALELHDSSAAMGLREKAIKTDPTNLDLVFGLAYLYKERGQAVKALGMYRNLCDSLPEDTYLLYSIGDILAGLGRKNEAQKYIDQITTLEPFAGEEYYEQAQSYPLTSQYGMSTYLKAARLGHRAAQDTLKSRGISW